MSQQKPRKKHIFTDRRLALFILLAVSAALPLIANRLLPDPPRLTPTPGAVRLINPNDLPTVNAQDPLARGKQLYDTYCAHCHGSNGEGQMPNIDSSKPDELGFMPVPPHNSQGHTWLHPDTLLKAVIRQGLPNPLYRYQMPAFGPELLSDAQLDDLLNYIKQWWTDAQRDFQAKVSTTYLQAQSR